MIEVNPRVKDALRSGAYRKNYRINVLNDDGTTDFTLNNTELVSESVKIDERMCSGDTLKFGLCEGSSIEFQYFNHDNINHPNIRGRRIQVFVDVQYKDADGEIAWEPIPLGYFDVQECSTQFSTGIMKVVGYNKLRSEYLDEKCNDAIVEAAKHGDIGRTGETSIGSLLQNALEEYAIEPDYESTYWTNIVDNVYEYHDVLASPTYVNMLFKKEGDTYIPINDDPQAGGLDNVYLWPVIVHITLQIPFIDEGYYRIIANMKGLYENFVEQLENSGYQDYYIYDVDNDEYISVQEYYERWTINDDLHIYTLNMLEITYDGIRISIVDQEESENFKSEYTYNSSPGVFNALTNIYFPVAWLLDRWQEDGGSTAQRSISNVLTDHAGEWENALTQAVSYILGVISLEKRIDSEMENIAFTEAQAEALPDVTLRELQSAVFETAAEFGQLSRTTDLFDGVTLSRERLFPADDLYPSDTLYPQGTSESTFKSMYEKLWTDSVGEQTFRKLYITYKGLDDQQREKEFVLERTVNANGTTDYYCDDNWLFKNLIWTEQQVGDYADAMVLKMRGIKWFPFEMWSAGLPYIEVGDELEINTKDGTYTSYVLQRSLNGIQNLKDTYINGSLDIF